MQEFFESLNTIDHIERLIHAGERESDNLEYKTAAQPYGNREKDDIAKDVSSFANSGGGVIIYGVATDPKDKTKPVALEAIDAANIETFDRVVNSKIQPPVPHWQKRLIPNEQPRVMVIFVPQSDDPPHQSLVDKKYYRRAGIESIPMTHDLIALLSERGKRTRLRRNLRLQYDSFKEETLHIILSASWRSDGAQTTGDLSDPKQFREYFKENASPDQTRWDAFLNGLNENHIKRLVVECEILMTEVNFTLNAIDVDNQDVFALLKRLNQSLHRSKNWSPEYDDVKQLSRFLWSVHTGWSFVTGYPEKDVIAQMIDAI